MKLNKKRGFMKTTLTFLTLAISLSSFAYNDWKVMDYTGQGSIDYKDINRTKRSGACKLTIASSKIEKRKHIKVLIEGLTAFSTTYENPTPYGLYTTVSSDSHSTPPIREVGVLNRKGDVLKAWSQTYLQTGEIIYNHSVSIKLMGNIPEELAGKVNKGYFSCSFQYEQ